MYSFVSFFTEILNPRSTLAYAFVVMIAIFVPALKLFLSQNYMIDELTLTSVTTTIDYN